MHSYSLGGSKEDMRQKITLWLFSLSVVSCTVINYLLDKLENVFPDVFQSTNQILSIWPWLDISINSFSAFMIFGLLYKLFDLFLWKLPLFNNYTGIIDYSGKWKGKLKSSFNPEKEIKMEVIIKQKWSSISIHSTFTHDLSDGSVETSNSWSDTAHIDPDHGLGSLIKFTYANRADVPSWDVREHRGENELFLVDCDSTTKQFNVLKGDYYNNRGKSGNVGVINLRRQ